MHSHYLNFQEPRQSRGTAIPRPDAPAATKVPFPIPTAGDKQR